MPYRCRRSKLGLKAGFDPQDILYTPNCVSIEEIEEAVELGVRINIDNICHPGRVRA